VIDGEETYMKRDSGDTRRERERERERVRDSAFTREST
jgi:hypothetical protein